MAPKDSLLYLAHMFDNIERICLWTNGHTLETYRANLMMRIGNVLRHEYDDVADTEVWRIIIDDLPALRSTVRSMIDRP